MAASSWWRFFARRGDATGRYRADIDGLRAIAVFAVILMHAGITAVRGGYLGVDIFFVISGYLVHQQVATRLDKGTFGLFAFYGRRLRRTFPALYLVTALCLAAGFIILMPGDFDALARSAIAACLGMSNILFAMQAGYFDHSALTKPLLHTWSLGVEEQYYLVAPLVPFAIRKLARPARIGVLLALFALDLGFCIFVQRLIPDITFFMMPPRLWEFFLGALVAEAALPLVKRQWAAELIAGLALAALLYGLFSIGESGSHPGWATLLPCLATAVLIQSGGTVPTLATRLLGLAPLAFCGLISYSLYLWHWPLIVFARYRDLPLDGPQLALGALLLFGLSTLSWRFVETPFRDPHSVLRRQALPILVTGLAGVALAGGAIIVNRGMQTRFSPEVAAITSYYDYADRRDYRDGTCFITSKYNDARYFDRPTCLKMSSTKPNYLLIGDSHGAHFWAGLSRVFTHINLLQATASGCKPVLKTTGLRYCVDLMHEALADFVPKAKLDGVIFSAAWLTDDIPALKATIDFIKPYVPKIIVIGDIPSHEIDLPNLIGRSMVEHRPELILANQSPYPWYANRIFERAFDPAVYVPLVDLICPQRRCLIYAGKDVPLQFDTSHLTTEGSVLVAKRLATTAPFAALVDGTPQRK